MKHIILDTNILHQEGLSSGGMRLLGKLANDNIIKIYIPEIVKREFITKRITEIELSLEAITKSLLQIDKKVECENKIKLDVVDFKSNIQNISSNVELHVNDDFDSWAKNYDVKIINFNPNCMVSVIDDYFTGKGAFRKLKSREDFPDSIIHKAIIELASNVNEVYVVVNDNGLKHALNESENVKIFTSIKELIGIDDLVGHVTNAKYAEILTSDISSDFIRRYLLIEQKILTDLYFDEASIFNVAILSDYVIGVEVNGLIPQRIRSLSITDCKAISEKIFIADITVVADSFVHYVSDYGTYLEHQRDDNRIIDLDSMNGDGICDLHEVITVKLYGEVTFSFKDDVGVEDLKEIIKANHDYSDCIALRFSFSRVDLLNPAT